ncbi:MAG: lactate racemase domain-containing protein [Peptococcaceae bacterium]|jgi:nickel-dependent lactate racemase|nr:lactate racemase domain-containing protein [Peptococcaceae bacterium]
MELCLRAEAEGGLSRGEIENGLLRLLNARPAAKVLIIPPDYTRFHSNAGFLTNFCFHYYTDKGARVDILPALGTHVPISPGEAADMYGDIPYTAFLTHNWRTDVERLGEVSGQRMAAITEGIWTEPIAVEINRLVTGGGYDLILSVGQVVPHEVIGMSNHGKNLFVGVGGADMINKSHMVGAVYGMERMMGRDHTPVREIFDYALGKYLNHLPILFLLTVTTAAGREIFTHGLFAGAERDALEAAIQLSQQKNIDFVERGIPKCVVYLDPQEYKSTWLGNKSVYRSRMAIADGGELIVLAPGVERFGEDEQVDGLIRKYGYRGREEILALFRDPAHEDLRANMGAAAHLIHGSSDGRFTVTYAVAPAFRRPIESAHFKSADYTATASRYDPGKLRYGYNTLKDGEEIYFIPNPALGLWINREKFIN